MADDDEVFGLDDEVPAWAEEDVDDVPDEEEVDVPDQPFVPNQAPPPGQL
jgi:hypothetical protein